MSEELRRNTAANPQRVTWRDEGTAAAAALGGPQLVRVDEPLSEAEAEELREKFRTAAATGELTVLTDQHETQWEDLDGSELVHPKRRRTREEWALLWAKSICWRAISTGTLFFIAWLVTGSWSTGGVVAMIHMVITIVIYVPHDLAWERYSARRQLRRRRRSGS